MFDEFYRQFNRQHGMQKFSTLIIHELNANQSKNANVLITFWFGVSHSRECEATNALFFLKIEFHQVLLDTAMFT